MRVYVVRGSEGEYSDRCEWPVAAYFSEHAAQARAHREGLRNNTPETKSYNLKTFWVEDVAVKDGPAS